MANKEVDYNKVWVEAAKANPEMYRVDSKTAGLWDKYAQQSGGLGPNFDYSTGVAVDGRKHYDDAGKMPWHPTFSGLSKYAGLGPHGTWDNTRPDGSGDFHLTKEMMTNDRMDNLQWMVDNKYTDGDRYFLPNGKQMEARKVADRLAK